MKFWILLLLALGLGLSIGWADTRPTWDDAGITVGAILCFAAVFGVIMPERAWVWALAISSGTSLLSIALLGNYGGLMPLIVAFLGSYSGAFFRKFIAKGISRGSVRS